MRLSRPAANRLRALRAPLLRLGRELAALVVGILRDFVWADLRDGIVDLRGLTLVTVGLVLFGFALLGLMILALLNADVWRLGSPLLVLANGVGRRGSLLPVALVPLTMFLISVAWSFLLVGALHSHPLFRLGALYLYVLTGLGWVSTTGVGDPTRLLAGLGLLLLVPVLFALRWRGRARPGVEFGIMFVVVGSTFVLVQLQGVESWRLSGVPLVLAYLGDEVLSYSLLITPLLLLAGQGMAEFALSLADWGAASAAQLPRLGPRLLLAGLLGWRLRDVLLGVVEHLNGGAGATWLVPYGVGLLMVLVTIGGWWLVRRRQRAVEPVEELVDEAGRIALPLVLVYYGSNLATYLLAATVGVVAALSLGAGADLIGAAQELANNKAALLGWQLAVDAGALLVGYRLAGRARAGLALFLVVFALIDVVRLLTEDVRPLGQPFDAAAVSAALDFVWVALFALSALRWLPAGRLTDERVQRLLLAVLLSFFIRQTDFIANRFSIFGFSGVGFLAFGLVWDALTIGSWANVDGRALPRTSRIFLYLGYVLLTVAVVNWSLTTHDLASQSRLTGDMALSGFNRFGRPMLYAVFLLVLFAPPRVDLDEPDSLEPAAELPSEAPQPAR